MPTTEPRWDPLGQGVRLAHRRTVFPLGFPLEAASNDAEALELVARAFPLERALFPGAPAMVLRLIVGEGAPLETPPVYRASGALLSLAGDANHALAADMDAGAAALWVTRSTIEARARFVRWWIAGPVLQMLSHRAVTPLHAACVAREGRGWLLCGPSGAGKSVLVWAAARAGFTFVSDDVSYLLRDHPGRVLGRPDLLRLKPSALGLVAGLEGFATVPDDAPGEAVYELDPAEDLGLSAAPECRLAGVVLLERGEAGEAALGPVSGAEALRLLDATLPRSAPGVTEDQAANLRWVASLPCRRLRYASAVEGAALLRA